MRIGVIVQEGQAATALESGVDFIEPVIVGNVVVQKDNTWIAGPAVHPQRQHPSFAIMFPGHLRLADPQADLQSTRDYLHAILPWVSSVAAPGAKLVLGSGAARHIPDGVGTEAGRRQLASSLKVILEITRSHGLEVVFEPLNRSETNIINSVAEAVAFLDEFGFGNVRVVADLYHIMLEGESLDSIARHIDRVGHAHIADTGRFAPGTGDWPIGEFLTTLRDGHYGGDLTIECAFNELGRELRDAVGFLRALT